MSKLTKKDISKAAWYWTFFHHCTQNYERMMGLAFCATLAKPLKKLYGSDKKGLSDALTRNMAFFNTEPQLGSLIPGMTLALEEAKANGEPVDPEVITSTKSALMGPFAGIGDSILVGTYNPILLSIGIGLSAGGSPIGAIFFFLTWTISVVALKYFGFIKGYSMGMDAVTNLLHSGLKEKIVTALNIIGLIVIGGVASTTVAAPIKLAFVAGEMNVEIQASILDKILPGLVPMLLTLLCYWLIDKKGWSANKIILLILAIAAVCVPLGIM